MYDLFEKKDVEEIYNITYPSVYNYFYYVTLKVEVAEDLTSKTYSRMLEKRHLYNPDKGGIKTWIMAIARNVWIDEYRRSGKIQFIALDEIESVYLQTEQKEYREIEEHLDIERMLSILSEKQRQILRMRYYMGLSLNEIAEIMNLTQSNISVILSRSIKKLRERFGEKYSEQMGLKSDRKNY